jgi:CO/xanthine dehydrogenase FAD-binding subunit
MGVTICDSLDAVRGVLADRPQATLLAGGTDLMVEVNFGRRRPDDVVAIGRVPELGGWSRDHGRVRLGAALTYREMLAEPLASLVPGLAQAARTVGSPQIRNAGTLGGNLGTASPAGDTLPVLAALDAEVIVGDATGGTRRLAIHDFLVGPKANACREGELVLGAVVLASAGRQEFLKVGTRNAMVIAVVSAAVVADPVDRSVRVAVGSAGPTVLRAREAEAWVAARIDWATAGVDPALAREFGDRVADSVHPIDDHRSTARYRRHAAGVLARRGLVRALAPGRER